MHLTSRGGLPRFLILCLVCLVASLGAGSSAFAVQPDEILSDAEMEKRARTISMELRCLVCQNQSIDDSDAPLARDLRLLVRERLQKGETNDEVLDFVVSRYGEFVLLKPPFGWNTLLLWLTPALVLVAGVWLARSVIAGNRLAGSRPDGSPQPLSADEEERLKRVLGGE